MVPFVSMTRFQRLSLLAATLLGLMPAAAYCGDVAVAAASNFGAALAELSTDFEQRSGHMLRISLGSTGKLYAQIANGAPFDVLLAADADRPALLEAHGHGVTGSRFTYATGSLVLWSRDPTLAGRDCREVLSGDAPGRIAIANPATAPYGAAARAYLKRAGLWDGLRPRLAYGENIAQALQFVVSGNARAGFIAAAQALDDRLPRASCRWDVPPGMHEPIEQQALLLRHGADVPAAAEFLEYLRGGAARAIIRRHGYRLPDV